MSTPRYPAPFSPLGPALRSGVELNSIYTADVLSSESEIIALGATQATAFQLRAAVNDLGTVAAGTGVKLPQPQAGMTVIVFNDGANPVQVYGFAGETIDGVAGAVGVPLANAKRCGYYCFMSAAGVLSWISAQLGAVSA